MVSKFLCGKKVKNFQIYFPEISWEPYETSFPDLPDGLNIGEYKDGSGVYVAKGPLRDLSFITAPGRLRIDPPKGIYISERFGESYQTTKIQYLRVVGDLQSQ